MPTPELLETNDDGAESTTSDADADADTDTDTDTEPMPDDTESESPTEQDADTTDADAETDGGEEEIDDEELAAADLPGEDETVEDGDGDSGGILSRLNTKAIIVIAAVAVGVVVFLRFLRSGRTQAPAGSEQEGQPDPSENVTSDDPLEADQQMMDSLGMGN